MLALSAVMLIALVFFGAQLQVPTISATPSQASFNSSNPTANTCAGCHGGSPSSGGSTSISGFPAGMTYTPGGPAIPLTVTVTDPNYSTYGFQLTARLASNIGTTGGAFTSTNSSASMGSGGAIQGSSSSSTFTFNWTPPSTASGSVNFYLTGLATSSLGSNAPYTAMYTLAAATAATPPPTLSATPSSLSFAYQIGGSTPAAQKITVGSSGAALNFTTAAATSSGGSWLSASPASGSTASGSLSVSVNPSGLAAGTYTGTVKVTSSGATGSPTTTNVTLVVSSATVVTPTLSASPSAMSFAYKIGGTSPASQPILVSATSSAVSFTAASSAAWLSASPTSGTTPGTVNVSVNPASLSAGTYTGTVKVTSSGATGSPTTTNVTLVVSSATVVTPTLSASPLAMSFAYTTGGTTPASQPILVSATPSAVSFTATSAGTWLSATPTSGTTPGTVNVSVNPSGLTAGSYTGTVSIASSGATGSPQIVHVTLVVSSAAGVSVLKTAPTSLAFSYQSGGAMPPSQKLTLTMTGTSTSYSASTSGGSWLSTSPNSGAMPGAVMVSVNPAGMSTGIYSGAIRFSASGASSISVPVTFNVTATSTCVEDCGNDTRPTRAEPYVLESSWSGGLAAMWVENLGVPTSGGETTGNLGLLLSKTSAAANESVAGAFIKHAQGSLTELGFDYRDGGQCTATSPRFVVVTTDSVTHTVGGCSKGTAMPAPAMGWHRVRFNLADATQTSPAITPGEQVSTLTLVLDEGPQSGAAAAGGLVVIDNIDVNGAFAEKVSSGPSGGFQPYIPFRGR